MNKNYKNFGFWTALAGAVVIFLNSLGQALGFSVESEIVYSIVTGFAGILVVLGIVNMPKKNDDATSLPEVDDSKKTQEMLQSENFEENFKEQEEKQDDFVQPEENKVKQKKLKKQKIAHKEVQLNIDDLNL